MPLVGSVGKRRWRARLAMAILYAVLTLGALTTVYPFFLMLTTGFKGPTDQTDNKLVPAYFTNYDGLDETGKPDKGSLAWKYLYDKYAGDLSQIESTRIGKGAPAEQVRAYEAFLRELPPEYWLAGFRTSAGQVTSKLSRRWQAWVRERFDSVEELNQAYIEENVAFESAAPPTELLERKHWSPPEGRKYRDWTEFKKTLPAEFRIPIREERLFQEFLKSKFQAQIGSVPAPLKGEASSFDEIRLPPPAQRFAPEVRPLYEEFRRTRLPERNLETSAEELWAQRSEGPMPIAAYESGFLADNEQAVKAEFATRNYRYVLDYILLHGRALWNTAIFCLLVILTQLIVNPLAAYALSRYPIRASGKILLFLLATMAFPAEVAMIPNFLLLKDLGLLNTFAALVLPGMASGYMIFLLKGFFDSLPQELFEAGQLDGAKEITMMTQIALPLSKPVLGYLALLAFMGAYGAFLYAFLVAQDQKMWTLMVWIYQLQNVAPKSVMMAALTLAAIPTLIVFLLAQNVIMRGIVLPGER
jgi:multiple sugar transport system permease protein